MRFDTDHLSLIFILVAAQCMPQVYANQIAEEDYYERHFTAALIQRECIVYERRDDHMISLYGLSHVA